MDSLADALGSAGKWLVIVGLIMFVGGFLLEAFGVKSAGPEEEKKSAIDVLAEIVKKAFTIAFSTSRPIGQRLSAGGILLIGLGLVAIVGGVIASAAGGGASADGAGTPSPTST